MTIAVDLGRKTTKQTNKLRHLQAVTFYSYVMVFKVVWTLRCICFKTKQLDALQIFFFLIDHFKS